MNTEVLLRHYDAEVATAVAQCWKTYPGIDADELIDAVDSVLARYQMEKPSCSESTFIKFHLIKVLRDKYKGESRVIKQNNEVVKNNELNDAVTETVVRDNEISADVTETVVVDNEKSADVVETVVKDNEKTDEIETAESETNNDVTEINEMKTEIDETTETESEVADETGVETDNETSEESTDRGTPSSTSSETDKVVLTNTDETETKTPVKKEPKQHTTRKTEGKGRLTAELKAKMIADYKNGANYHEIADRYGLNPNTVSSNFWNWRNQGLVPEYVGTQKHLRKTEKSITGKSNTTNTPIVTNDRNGVATQVHLPPSIAEHDRISAIRLQERERATKFTAALQDVPAFITNMLEGCTLVAFSADDEQGAIKCRYRKDKNTYFELTFNRNNDTANQ